MERIALEAHVRDAGKSMVRRLRRTGKVPGVVYGRTVEARPVTVDAKSLRAALHTQAGLNVLIDLSIRLDGNEDSRVVRVKDLQRDIFTHEITHVDFHAISLTETLEANVPVHLTGTPKGIGDGGVLEHHLREVLVECLPTQIPESFQVDVSGLDIGDAIHVSELTMPEGVTLLTPPGEVIATVLAPRKEEEPVPVEAAAPTAAVPGEEAAEAAAVAAPAPGAAREEKKVEKGEKGERGDREKKE